VLDEVIFRLIFNDYQVGTKARAVRLTTRNLLVSQFIIIIIIIIIIVIIIIIIILLSFLFTILADYRLCPLFHLPVLAFMSTIF